MALSTRADFLSRKPCQHSGQDETERYGTGKGCSLRSQARQQRQPLHPLVQLLPELFKPLRLSHAPLNTLDYIPDLVPGSFCAETTPVARAQVLKCILDEARTLVDDRPGHIVEDLETRRELVLLVRGHDLRRIHGEQKRELGPPRQRGPTCLHQHPHQDVEVMPELLVFPGASAAGGPASHADCAAELDGELAELDDVA